MCPYLPLLGPEQLPQPWPAQLDNQPNVRSELKKLKKKKEAPSPACISEVAIISNKVV